MPAKTWFAPFRAVGRAVGQFFDGKVAVKQIELPGPKKVEWLRNMPYFGMHAACLLVFFAGFSG